jgi:hypothetical protein
MREFKIAFTRTVKQIVHIHVNAKTSADAIDLAEVYDGTGAERVVSIDIKECGHKVVADVELKKVLS